MTEIKLPDVELNIYTPKDPVEAEVVENYIVTNESSPNFVRHMTFDISGTELENRLRVGQSIGVLPPGVDENGRAHKLRLYSISSPTSGEGGKANLVSTTVKRTIEEFDKKLYLGVASNYLADLQPGDKLKLTGPSGRRFLLPENARDFNYVFFATGTGIAPFRGMITELFEEDFDKECVLVFGCPYRTDLLYADLFMQMAEENENFHYLTRISREDRREDGSKKYVQTALVDDAGLLKPILHQDNTLLYICGMKGMETGIYKALLKHELYSYLEIRKKLPDDWDSLDEKEFKRKIKPSGRTFEEVY
ncbi:MAG: FAD-binding oxidoreductase [Balneolaceae bacterium]